MALSLVRLPPTVLSCITRYLNIEVAWKLIKASGDRSLWAQCVHHGGWSELIARHNASPGSAVQFVEHTLYDCLPNFACLTHLIIAYYLVPALPLWAMYLPPTLVEVQFGFLDALAVLMRPVVRTDSDEVKYLTSFMGLTPDELNTRFPRLTALSLETEATTWTAAMFTRFMANLPPSLTSLAFRSHLTINIIDYSERFSLIPPQHILRTLERLELSLRSPALALSDVFQVPCVPDMPEPLIAAALSSWDSLRALTLALIDVQDPLLSRLHSLATLTLLDLTFEQPDQETTASPLTALPPLLQHLYLDMAHFINFPALLASAPDLRTLHLENTVAGAISIEFDGITQTGLTDLRFLPAKLERLHSRTFHSNGTVLGVLPDSLTSLTVDSVVSTSVPRWELASSLRTLSVPPYAILIGGVCTPPALTELTFTSFSPCLELEQIANLPTSMRIFKGPVRLEPRHAPLFANLESLSQFAMSCRLQALYFPQLPPSSVGDTLLFSLTVHPELLAGLMNSLHPQTMDYRRVPFLPASVTSFSGSFAKAVPLNPKTLPRALKALDVGSTDLWTWPAECPASMTGGELRDGHVPSLMSNPDLHLPLSLESLHLHQPKRIRDTVTGLQCFYPLLATAPNLTKLKLTPPPSACPESCFLQLPPTITDLEIAFGAKGMVHAPLTMEWVHDDWLPNLTRLKTNGATVPLRNFVNRLARLTLFEHACVRVCSGLPRVLEASAEWNLREPFLNEAAIERHYRRCLLPPHLRLSVFELTFEWSPELLAELPRDLVSLHLLSRQVLSDSPAGDLGRHLPNSLRHLQLEYGVCTSFEDATALPRTLESLIVHKCAKSLFFGLPDSLTHLRFNSPADTLFITRDMILALPRGLKVLCFADDSHYKLWRFSPASDVLLCDALPPTLVRLHIQATPAITCQELCAILKSLVYLQVAYLPKDQENSWRAAIHAALPLLRHFQGNAHT